VSKDAIQRILAPSADYIGAGVLQGTKATVNVVRVLAAAARRLGSRLNQPGSVPPRVLKNVLDDAPWIEDELMAEYQGGILASSFGENSRDDRAVALQATLRRLSTYALRTHYVCYVGYYLTFRDIARWEPVCEGLSNLHLANDDRMYAPHHAYVDAMDLTESEKGDYFSIYRHSFNALDREGLIHELQMGDRQFLIETLGKEPTCEIPDDGFVYRPSQAGEELLLWGLGRGDLDSALLPDDRNRVDEKRFDQVSLEFQGAPRIAKFIPLELLTFGAV
jgi:hypothetical protein